MARKTKKKYPFFFFGQGFGTSYKCLEGHLWFEKPPSKAQRTRIVKLLPKPVLLGVRFVGSIMHFGSDDRLEGFVKATYNPKYRNKPFDESVEELERIWASDNDKGYWPTPRDWTAFCDHFEKAVLAIHEVCRLFLVIKPDDGEHGKRLGPWHAWSVENALAVAERASREKRKTTRDMSYLAVNLLQDVLDAEPEKPEVWLAWLEKLAKEGDRDLRDTFREMADDLRGSS